MDMDLERVRAEFAALLSDKPRGTTADITDHAVVYWDGERPMGVHLWADHPGFDDRFELDHHFCGDVHEHLTDWFAHPRYSSHPNLVAWLDALGEASHGD
ncbi:MAG: hypothetical protein QOJ04_6049 [Caballeronia sp.]|jgi:hypothetical protein|nr:hypothetical protein [Caballeronia sp.]MEA3112836.1 hypothetical protein [Caballeronia sp.]